MIDSEYYSNYKGPQLISAKIWKTTEENNKEDITSHITNFYGENNNWNGKLYKYKDIFKDKGNYNFYFEFKSLDKRKQWFYGIVGDQDQYFPPIIKLLK